MKFQTSALTGMMLDFACAQFDSHCEGLTWEFRGDHYVGLFADEDGEKHVASVICECRFKRMLEICRDYKLQHQLVYSPSTKWAQGGKIIEIGKIRLDGGDNQWRLPSWKWAAWPKSGNGYSDNSPLVAAMRAFVASKAGDTIDLAGAV